MSGMDDTGINTSLDQNSINETVSNCVWIFVQLSSFTARLSCKKKKKGNIALLISFFNFTVEFNAIVGYKWYFIFISYFMNYLFPNPPIYFIF